jgi:uncharacterized protein (TIRG00374 family)
VSSSRSLSPSPTGESVVTPPASRAAVAGGRARRLLRALVLYSVIGALLYVALRNVPLEEIWNTVSQLQAWQVGLIFALNLFIYALITLRWWIIVHAQNRSVAYFPLLLVGIAVFGVSYFTLGPHIGGEALQVFYLQRRYNLPFTHATASVVMDKLLELLANFVLLIFGFGAILRAGLFSGNGNSSWLSVTGLLLLCMWPPVHILLLYQQKYPLSALLRRIPWIKKGSKPVRFIAASERLAGTFCHRHLSSLLLATGVAICAGMGMVTEFALIASFLGIELPFWQTIAAWTAGWLSLLAPVPGGLGALEASEVLALGAFGVPAALALSVTLVMRGRDLLISSLGLLLAGRAIRK